MGTRSLRRTGLADALFSPVQQRVLGLLYGQPERAYQSAELFRLARGGIGAVHRQLERLSLAGLVVVTRSGNQKYYRANPDSPVFAELRGLIAKTVGIAGPIGQALAPHASAIQAAFIYGSLAKGNDKASSDIDLMVLSKTLHYSELYDALAAAERLLGRKVNPTLMKPSEWRRKIQSSTSFAARVRGGSRLFVIGGDDDVS